MRALDFEGVLTDLFIVNSRNDCPITSPRYLYPPTQQHSIPSDELLVAQTNDERVQKRPPRIFPLPFCVQKVVAKVVYRRVQFKAAFGVEGLVEEHGEDGGRRGHYAGEEEGEDDLGDALAFGW